MGFFNTIKDLSTERKDFKQWEQSQNDVDAKRSALHSKKHFTPEELAKAKKLGQTITDVVDVMDQHSEDVSEDVEAATQPIVGAAPFIAAGLTGFASYKFVLKKKFSDYTKNMDKIIKENGIDELLLDLNRKGLITIKATGKNKQLHSHELMNSMFNANKRLLKKLDISDKNASATLNKVVEQLSTEHKKWAKPLSRSIWGTVAVGVLGFVGLCVWATKEQLLGSRIGRWQARKKLENEKYFVQYTDEQIAQARENLKNKKPEKKSFFSFGKKDKQESDGFFKNIWNVVTQRRAYKKWKKEDTDDAKLVTRELTPEEIKEAKADQEIIQRVVRKINNKAEEYSENMETAANTILLSSYLGGGALGAGFAWVLNKFGIAEKFVKNRIGKICGQEGTALLDKILEEEKNPKGILSKWFDTVNPNSSKNKLRDVIQKSLSEAKPKAKIKNGLKTLFYSATTYKFSRNIMITAAASVLTGIAGLLISLKLQKNAARAGRFAAKQELLEDPKNFISHDEQDLEQVKDVKAEKAPLGKRLKEYLLFVPKSVKQCWQYEKYKKEVLKPSRDLKEELIKLDVSDKQLKDAKNLQRKLFNTFEKVDDKSQEYSETMEVVNEVGETTLSQVPGIVMIGVPIIFFGKLASGKMTLGGLGKKILNTFSKLSWVLKSKLAKKHLTQMNSNLVNVVKNTNAPKTWAGVISQGILSPKNINKLSDSDFIQELCTKHKIAPNDLKKILFNLSDNTALIEKMEGKSIKEILKVLEYTQPSEGSILRELLVYLDNIKKTPINDNFINRIIHLKSHNAENFVPELEKLPDFFSKFIPSDILKEFSKVDDDVLKGMSGKTLNDLPEYIKGLPEGQSKTSLNTLLQYLDKPIFSEKVSDAKGTKTLMDSVFSNSISDYMKASMNKETLINTLRIKLSKYSDDDITKFNNMLEEFSAELGGVIDLGKASRATLTDNIDKLEKILNNLPQKELNQLFDTFQKLLKENPKEFAYLLTTKPQKLFTTMNTPVLQNTMLALGITGAVGTVSLTFAIASLLAKLQKDAGRFGVMKAMHDLEDYRYYANSEKPQNIEKDAKIIPTAKNTQPVPHTPTNSQTDFFNQFVQKKLNQS